MNAIKIRRPWKNSLIVKLLIRFWLGLLLFALILGGIQYQALHQSLLKGKVQDLQAQIGSFDPEQIQIWLSHKQPFPTAWPDLSPGIIVGFFSENRTFEAILSHQETTAKKPYPEEKAFFINQLKKNKQHTNTIMTNSKGARYLVITGPLYLNQAAEISVSGQNTKPSADNKLIGYAALAAPLSQINTILNHQLLVLLSSTVLILVVSGILAFYILRKPLQPLARMADISEKIAAGNFSLRIPEEPSASEIVHLRFVLNYMLETLNKSLTAATEAKEQMARFISDASHELRTPLTSIRGFLEILQRGPETDQDILTSAHATMLTETERLIQLTEDLLTINRLSNHTGQADLKRTETALQAAVPELLPLLDSLLADRTLEIQNGDLSLPLESGELKQIIYNLVHNAIRHTPTDGKITITFGVNDNSKYLRVADNGEGIPAEVLPHIFERFYRGSNSRERKNGSGAGLGLSIVGEIVTLREGKLEVQSTINKGSTFTIYFPV